MSRERIYPEIDVRAHSPNVSSRLGARPTLIVVHATAGHNFHGLKDLRGLAAWGANPASEVSWHGATDNEGNSLRQVSDLLKAWHCGAFNRCALGLEQVIPGDGTEITEELYRETARWIALWSKRHHIPIRQGKTSGLQVIRSGVVTHKQLGVAGGNHDDPGPRYDMHHVRALARHYRSKM